MINPMVLALVLSVIVAVATAPQTTSFFFPRCWGDLPGAELVKSLGPSVQRLRALFPSMGSKEVRGPKGGPIGSRGPKDKSQHGDRDRGSSGRERADIHSGGKPEKVQTGRQEGRPPPTGPSVSTTSKPLPPACFVCLDRPSRYM